MLVGMGTMVAQQLTEFSSSNNHTNVAFSPLALYTAFYITLAAAPEKTYTYEYLRNLLGVQNVNEAANNILVVQGAAQNAVQTRYSDNKFDTHTIFMSDALDDPLFRFRVQKLPTCTILPYRPSIEALNQWALQKDVPQPLSSLDQRSTAVLLASAKLQVEWETPFKSSNTKTMPFIGFNNNQVDNVVNVDMMHGKVYAPFLTTDDSHMVFLPYESDHYNNLMAVAILPKDQSPGGITNAITDWLKVSTDIEDEGSPYRSIKDFFVQIGLPKFDFVHSENDYMGKIPGLLEAINQEATTNLSGAALNEAVGRKLMVTQLASTTKITVDEKGTMAETTVAMEFTTRGLPPQEPKVDRSIIFNRPFIFIIVIAETLEPIFYTVVTQPNAKATT